MEQKRSKASLLPLALLLAAKAAKLAKLFKLVKPMITIITMSISAIAYAFWQGPWFALGLIAMLFIHEMGHVAAMRMRGYEASAPVFIPFIGAFIAAPRIKCRDDEAFIGLGGPALGGLAAILVFLVWYFTDDKTSGSAMVLFMVSYIGTFLNVFNLVPMRPLDGGRVTQAIGSWFKYVGAIVLALISLAWREPVIMYVWLLVLPELTMIPLKLRAIISFLVWVSMTALMWLGYSSQPFWIDVMDIVLGGVFMVILVIQAYNNTDYQAEDEERAELTKAEKISWFVRYLLLTIVLGSLMWYQIQHLPKV